LKRNVKIAMLIVIIFVVIIVAAAAASSGGSKNNATDNNSNNNVNPSNNQQQTTVPPAASPADIVLSGTGDNVSNSFTLTAGVAIFQMNYEGSSNFAIWLDNHTGKQTDLLVNDIGSYSGSKLEGVTSPEIIGPTPGSYYLDVTASGKWNVTIKQPRVTLAANLPQTFAGTSDGVPSAFTLTSGAIKFDMRYTGTSNFAVWLYDANGNHIDLLANEIGSYSGAKSESILNSGIYYLDVTGVGSWSITVTHM
jgi:hypothetical protein